MTGRVAVGTTPSSKRVPNHAPTAAVITIAGNAAGSSILSFIQSRPIAPAIAASTPNGAPFRMSRLSAFARLRRFAPKKRAKPAMRIPVSAAPRNTHGATKSTPVPPTRTPSRYALIESRPGIPDRSRTVATSAPLSRTVDGRTGDPVDENVMIAVSPRGTPRGREIAMSVVANPRPCSFGC